MKVSRLIDFSWRSLKNPVLVKKTVQKHLASTVVQQIPLFKKIDIVNFDDVFCFMFSDDNLYENYVPEHRKRCDASDIAKLMETGEINLRVPGLDTIAATTEPEWVLHALLAHCWNVHQPVQVLDVGAHTGVVGLRLARFAQAVGKPLRVVAFEPGSMAELAGHNIKLNKLEASVSLQNYAVSTYNGFAVLNLMLGSSDGDRLSDASSTSISRVVEVRKLDNLLAELPQDMVTLLKLDTEGLEPSLIEQTKIFRKTHPIIPVFEFMPWRYEQGQASLVLQDLKSEFVIFDIGYTPHPWRVREIKPEQFEDFIADVMRRPFGYTDLLALPRILPGFHEACPPL